MSNRIKENQYIEEIDYRLSQIPQDRLRFTINYLSTYMACLIAKGKNSPTTENSLILLDEIRKILKEEKKLLKYIERNLQGIDLNALEHLLLNLLDNNEQAMSYYSTSLDDINNSHFKAEVTPREKTFVDITKTPKYRREVVSLTMTDKDVRKWLNAPEEFWEFINNKITIIPVVASYQELKEITAVIPIKDKDNKLCSIKLLLPEVVDLETAKRAIELYYEAYQAYNHLGQEYKKNKEENTNLQEQYLIEIDRIASTKIKK